MTLVEATFRAVTAALLERPSVYERREESKRPPANDHAVITVGTNAADVLLSEDMSVAEDLTRLSQ